LPAGLRDLSLSESRPSELEFLPESLESLRLAQTNPTRQIEDLSSITRLGRLRKLVLTGQEILSLEGIPSGVESLTVELGRLKFALLPNGLRRLTVIGGEPWVAENMPHRIDGLTLDSWQPAQPLLKSAPFLDGLSARQINLRDLGDLPDSILDLELYGNLKRLPELPPNLEKLYISADQLDVDGHPDSSDLDELPGTIEDLALISYPAITLPSLPPGLHRLDLSWSRVRHLEPLEKLQELVLTGVHLEAGSPLPPNLRTLVWQGYPREELRVLPASLQVLDVASSPKLERLSELPAGLRELHVAGTGLAELPDPLPTELKVLDVSGCMALSALPSLPDGLQTLVVSAGQVESLGEVPESLAHLEVVSLPIGP